MPHKNVESIRTHGSAGYNAGCKCETCRAAVCLAAQRRRLRAGTPLGLPRTVRCVFCGNLFHPKGVVTHEQHCRL